MTTFKVFKSLRGERFARLIPKMSFGQHALLMKTWKTFATMALLVTGNFPRLDRLFIKLKSVMIIAII